MAVTFPERPGRSDCRYFMRTGSCKYGSSRKYHHPKERHQVVACTIGPFGLPLRPGERPCTFCATYGNGKFGATCKFDHPSVAALPLQQPSLVFPYTRGSESSWTIAENSSCTTTKIPDELCE
ncbi:unnamed protein product [Musa hybrid cultivar]